MNRLEALEHLRRLGSPVFRTREAALALGEPDSTAQATLDVLAQRGMLTRLRRGWWLLSPSEPPDVGSLAPHLAAPFRAYVSFETALFRHGWITQIPPRVTVATLGRSRRITTAVGTFELRQLPPDLFGPGDSADPPWLAIPEKAAFDWAYRAAHGGYRSARFPEIEPTGRVDTAALAGYVARVPSSRVRATTARILRERMKLLPAADLDDTVSGRTSPAEGQRSSHADVSRREAAGLEMLERLQAEDASPVAPVLQQLASEVIAWFASPDPDLMLHLSSLRETASRVRGPAADPARALGAFVGSIAAVAKREAPRVATRVADPGATDGYRSATTELIEKVARSDERGARACFRRVSDGYARLLLLSSARAFHQGATFFVRQRARLMLDDLAWAASHSEATSAPPKADIRRTVEAFPSVLLAFDAANNPDREEPLLTAEVAAAISFLSVDRLVFRPATPAPVPATVAAGPLPSGLGGTE